MEIRNITTFLKVAELLHFSKAAEQLNYTQAAVTLQIKQLEEELGVKLFDRIGTKVSLTEPGISFIQYARNISESVDEAKNFIAGTYEPAGVLRIGIVHSLHSSVLIKLLPSFCRRYPLIENVIKTRPSDELVTMLQQDEVDIIHFAGKQIYDHKWVKVLEKKEKLVFAVSSGHKLAGKQVLMEELLDEPFMLTEKRLCYRYDLEQYLASRGFKLEPHLETCNPDHIVDLLKSTDSISFLPVYVVKEAVEKGSIAMIDVIDAQIDTCIQLIHRSDKTLTSQMQAFIDTIQEYYST